MACPAVILCLSVYSILYAGCCVQYLLFATPCIFINELVQILLPVSMAIIEYLLIRFFS